MMGFEPPVVYLKAELLDQLGTFMTTEPTPSFAIASALQVLPPDFVAEMQATEKIRFGLWFDDCRLKTECLVLLQGFFDQVFVDQQQGKTRHFMISSLDLSHNSMGPPQLAVLTDIISKNGVYEIQELVLNWIMGLIPFVGAQQSLTLLLTAIFKKSLRTASCLRRVSLDIIALQPQHFAIICSALRYNCSIVDLWLGGTGHSDERDSWMWLAFGAFHARSTQIHGHERKLCKLDLLGYYFTLSSVSVFARVLQNSAELLLSPDSVAELDGI